MRKSFEKKKLRGRLEWPPTQQGAAESPGKKISGREQSVISREWRLRCIRRRMGPSFLYSDEDGRFCGRVDGLRRTRAVQLLQRNGNGGQIGRVKRVGRGHGETALLAKSDKGF